MPPTHALAHAKTRPPEFTKRPPACSKSSGPLSTRLVPAVATRRPELGHETSKRACKFVKNAFLNVRRGRELGAGRRLERSSHPRR